MFKVKNQLTSRLSTQNAKHILFWSKTFGPDAREATLTYEVEKVIGLARYQHEEDRPENYKYLVKWLSYPYEDCTWQSFEDLNGSRASRNQALRELPVHRIRAESGLTRLKDTICFRSICFFCNRCGTICFRSINIFIEICNQLINK